MVGTRCDPRVISGPWRGHGIDTLQKNGMKDLKRLDSKEPSKKTITLSVNARCELHLFRYCHNTMNLEFSNQTPRSMKFNIYLEFSKPPWNKQNNSNTKSMFNISKRHIFGIQYLFESQLTRITDHGENIEIRRMKKIRRNLLFTICTDLVKSLLHLYY